MCCTCSLLFGVLIGLHVRTQMWIYCSQNSSLYRYITIKLSCSKTYHWTRSWASSVRFQSSQPIFRRSKLILPFHLILCLQRGFPIKIMYVFFVSPMSYISLLCQCLVDRVSHNMHTSALSYPDAVLCFVTFLPEERNRAVWNVIQFVRLNFSGHLQYLN